MMQLACCLAGLSLNQIAYIGKKSLVEKTIMELLQVCASGLDGNLIPE